MMKRISFGGLFVLIIAIGLWFYFGRPKYTKDETITPVEMGELMIAVMKTPESSDYDPFQVIGSRNEADHYDLTIQHTKNLDRIATFRISKANRKAEVVSQDR
jgi:hypothetical protein